MHNLNFGNVKLLNITEQLFFPVKFSSKKFIITSSTSSGGQQSSTDVFKMPTDFLESTVSESDNVSVSLFFLSDSFVSTFFFADILSSFFSTFSESLEDLSVSFSTFFFSGGFSMLISRQISSTSLNPSSSLPSTSFDHKFYSKSKFIKKLIKSKETFSFLTKVITHFQPC